ncbi:MAG: diguanylate cyclase [Thermodesulfobacteriota bacterium]
MKYEELLNFLQNIDKDPSRLIFEDELTGVYNRRFLLNYFQHKVPWDALQDHPLSLIMMDVDHFKQINDTYGHDAGDQALVGVASLLKEVSADEILAVRYAGDEFMILMTHREKKAALQLGQNLLQRIHEQPLRIGPNNQKNGALHLTLSMGVASAPEDAQTGKSLIQKADTALYYAKKAGRDRLANAGEIAPQEVFPKTALYQLEGEKIAGRKQQLALVSDFLTRFSQGQNHFLIVEGSAGMGKSTFLETIHRNLAQNKMIRLAKVNGITPEILSPYYMTTKILVELLNQREDRGVGVFEKLNPKDIAYLSNILPQMEDLAKVQLEDDPKAIREGIFNTLLHFIPQVIESHPLVLLVDDLQYADGASLILLRQLMLGRQFPLFICGTSTDPRQFKAEEQEVPLEGFYQAYSQELDIHKISLPPLTAADITEHLQGVFPQVKVPQDFEKYLEQTTQGNPLFLGEILHNLVLDQKITLMGQQWVIEPMEKDDLPKSLEAMINQKIATLDEESRRLLLQAATFGEGVSLSLLTGGSEKAEAEVLEFVDQAVAQGLLRSDFQLNDETIRFRSKRILEIADGAIQTDEKQKLHERIGNYKENLFRQRLLPSAAPLAYHYKRSTNQEKARTYEQFQARYTNKIFNSLEAVQYSVERRVPPPGAPLDPISWAQVPTVIRCWLTSLRNIRLYPPGSDPITAANRQLKEAIDPILAKNETLTIFKVKQALMVNSQKMDVSEFKVVAEELAKLMERVELQGVILHRGLSLQEVEVLLESLGRIKPKMITKDYWQRFPDEHQLPNVELKQVQYTIMVEGDGQARREKTSPGVGMAVPTRSLSQLLAGAQKLDQDDMTQIPDIIRTLLNAAKNIKLYPLNSKTISSSMEQLLEALQSILTKRHVLTFAQVSDSFLVNGIKIDPSGIETLVEGVQKFLDSIMLTSLTFLEGLSTQELQTFFGALDQQPSSGIDREFWARFSREQGLSCILFDQVLYEPRMTSTLTYSDQDQVMYEPRLTPALGFSDQERSVAVLGEEIEPVAEELFDAFLKAMPGRVNDLLIADDEKQVQQTLQRLFQGFQGRTFATREKVVESCRRMLENLTLALQHHFAKLLAEPLGVVLDGEKDSKILREIAALLHHMATNLIQFAEYPLASRILLHLRRRIQQLEEDKDLQAQRLAKILERKLEPTSQKLLIDDLKTGEPSRQQNAALLLGGLGRVSIPLLLDIIKKTEELRIRQLAASLLGELGTEGAELLKRELVVEGNPEERSRILEVIDTVTRDLKTELAYALGDGNPAVRQAAFQLAERLNDTQVVSLLLEYSKNQDPRLAVQAMECLGRLKPAGAVDVLLPLLNASKEPERLIACCHALGQIADPASIEPLAKILTRRGFFFFRKRERAQVRAAAIFALGQISHPRVAKVFTLFLDDPDPRVREMARTRLSSGKLPTVKTPVKK